MLQVLQSCAFIHSAIDSFLYLVRDSNSYLMVRSHMFLSIELTRHLCTHEWIRTTIIGFGDLYANHYTTRVFWILVPDSNRSPLITNQEHLTINAYQEFCVVPFGIEPNPLALQASAST